MWRLISSSIALKLTSFLALMALVVSIIVGLIFEYEGHKHIWEIQKELIEHRAEDLGHRMMAILRGKQDRLRSKSYLSDHSLKSYLKTDNTYLGFWRLTPDLKSAQSLKGPKHLRLPATFRSLLTQSKANETIVSDFILVKNEKESIPAIYIGHKNKNGSFSIGLEQGKDVFQVLEQGDKSLFRFYLINLNGDYLIHPHSNKTFGFEKGLRYFIQSDFGDIDNEFLLDDKLKKKMIFYKDHGDDQVLLIKKFYLNKMDRHFYFSLGVGVSKHWLALRYREGQLSRVAWALSLVIIVVLVGWLVTSFIMRNLQIITKMASRYTHGDINVSLDIQSEDEIGILARTFQGMVRQVNERTRVLRKSERETREARDQAEQALLAKSELLDDMKKQKAEIEKVSRDKDELLAIVSHDLKNPLAVIETSLDILIEENTEFSATSNDLIRRSKNSAKFALNLITDLLDLARLEGGIRLDFEKFKVKEMINNVLDSYFLKSQEKGISIITEIDKDYEISGDYARIVQVINNILGNALKFTPRNGKIKFKITSIQGRRLIDGSSEILRIEIADNGPGIPSDKIDTIFNKFEQARVKDREIGTGLGLAICKNICSLHNGDIWVESQEGKGSTFIITLPRVLSHTSEATPIISEGRPTLLLVDDSIEIIRLYQSKLKSLDVDLLTAYNGLEALEILEKSAVDLIILDLEMPYLNGLETLKRIRANAKLAKTPVIISTEAIDTDMIEQVNREADALLRKSEDIVDLADHVRSYLFPDEAPKYGKSIDSGQKTILVAEDDDGIREIITEGLKGNNYNIISAKNGVEALFLYKKYDISLLITDIRMPEIDGLTMAKMINGTKQEVPIILISGNLMELPKEIKEKLGIIGLLPKPFDMEELEALIDKVFDTQAEISESEEDYFGDETLSEIESIVEKAPALEEAAQAPPSQDKTKETHAINAPTDDQLIQLLLVDDSDDMHMLFKVLTKGMSIELDTAKNGEEGLSKIKSGRYDFVFMDINMPIMTGLEAISKLRTWEQGIGKANQVVVALSANDSEKDQKEYAEAGFTDSLGKPFNKVKIKALLDLYCESEA